LAIVFVLAVELLHDIEILVEKHRLVAGMQEEEELTPKNKSVRLSKTRE
jgi:hypothetical protein